MMYGEFWKTSVYNETRISAGFSEAEADNAWIIAKTKLSSTKAWPLPLVRNLLTRLFDETRSRFLTTEAKRETDC